MAPFFDLASHRPAIDPAQIDELRRRVFDGDSGLPEIPGYRIETELGRGAFARVYRAFDPSLGRQIALKVIPVDSRRSLLRIDREAQALGRISHPNVVQVYDKGPADEGSYFIALEYVEGQTLDEWLASRERPLKTIVARFLQAAEGLVAAHDAGLVHRDFKPANAIVGDDDRLRVVDFGLARAGDGGFGLGSESWSRTDSSSFHTQSSSAGSSPSSGRPSEKRFDLSLTADGLFVGTPFYAAPEQSAGVADHRSDQFSFCVALFEAVYGRRPFALKKGGNLALQLAAQRVDYKRGRRRIPRWLVALLRRGLEIDPAKRYPSMATVVERLRYRSQIHPGRLRVAGLVGAAVIVTAGVASRVIETESERIVQCRAERELVPEAFTSQLESIRSESPNIADELAVFTDRWHAERGRVCNEPEPERRKAADACLEVSRSALGDLGSWLAQADAEQWESLRSHPGPRPLAGLIDTLPDPSRCVAEGEGHDADQRLPIWERLLVARKGQAAGEIDEAADAAQRAIEEARVLGDRPLQIAAEYQQLVLDVARQRSWSLGSVLELIVEAHAAGESALAADIAAFSLLNNAAGRLMLDSDSPAHSLSRVTLDLAALRTKSGGSPLIAGWLGVAEGYARMGLGEYPEAEKRFHQAAEQLRRTDPPTAEHLLAMVDFHEAMAISGTSEPGSAVALATDAIALRRRTLGPRHPLVGNDIRRLGEIFVQIDDFDAALKNLQEADLIFDSLGLDLDRAIVRNEIAQVRYEQARKARRKAQAAERAGANADDEWATFDRYRSLALTEVLVVDTLAEPFRPDDDQPEGIPPRIRAQARIETMAMRIYSYQTGCWDEVLLAGRRLHHICKFLDGGEQSCVVGRRQWLDMLERDAAASASDVPCRPAVDIERAP